ncbi:MAG: hypothetical protein A3K68_03720 [Euryarchaeota archaeon RBG_16_68_13]|nr:MAG: hypothetical protein A3K68_03720 [Euryarchaeota archaeon RBG_16_68_13]
MTALPIHWIEIRSHVHATEDEDRVRRVLDGIALGGGTTREALEGHFGNPIVRLVRRIEGRREIAAAWAHWRSAGLLPLLRTNLLDRLGEDGVLHVRLGKQAAYLGRFEICGEGDSIDVALRLAAFPAKPEAFREAARELLEEGS